MKSQETGEEFWEHMLERRGIEKVCKKCNGYGVYTYPSTSMWAGGIGGQMMTKGICDRCWGSGDEKKKWFNLRKLEGLMRNKK